MTELLSPLVALLTVLYGAAMAGQASALALRATLRGGGGRRERRRPPSAREAAACALLAPLSVLALPLAPLLHPLTAGYFARAHDAWHGWERLLHAAPPVHAALHVLYFALLGAALVALCRAAYSLARARGVSSALRRMSATPPERLTPGPGGADLPPVFCLPTERPLCFTAGALRPRVYISRGLLRRLSARDRAAVLAHEAAHVRRRDGRTGALLDLFYTLFPLPGSRLIRRDWERAAERACDAEAARRVGDPCDVAAALLEVARLVALSPPNAPAAAGAPLPGAAHFAAPSGEDVEGRVRALLALSDSGVPDRHRRGDAALALAALAALHLTGLLLAETWLRHAAELLAHH